MGLADCTPGREPHSVAACFRIKINRYHTTTSPSPDRGELDYLRINLSTYGDRVFAYAGPTTWNSLPGDLGNIHLSLSTFKPQDLLFLSLLAHSALLRCSTETRCMSSLLFFITSAKEDCNRRCLSVCLSATSHKNVRTDLHESFRKVANGPVNKCLNFGGDPGHRLQSAYKDCFPD